MIIDKNNSTETFEQNVILFYSQPNSIAATAKAFQITPYKVGCILAKHSITKHNKETQYRLQTKQRNQTCLEKYGVVCSLASQEVKQKRDATMQLRYGAIYSGQSEVLRAKKENTCLKKYGTKHASQNAEIKAKTKQTNQARYGVDYFTQTLEFKKQIKQTCNTKYGTDYYLQTDEFKEKSRQTCLEKYGVEYSFQSENNKQKSLASKKKNSTMTSSSFERDLENFLIANSIDYKTQYKTQVYPFHCDFYLPQIDTFIELNLNWTHGKHFFDPESKEDITTLKAWQQRAKQSGYYESAVEVWTKRDPLKRDVAIQNKLNYICIFNRSELESLKTDLLLKINTQVKDGTNYE